MRTETENLLAAAAKEEPRKPDPFPCLEKPILAMARSWLGAAAAMEEQQERLKLYREKILEALAAWHLEQCRGRGAWEPSVTLETAKGTLRVTFQHRYAVMPQRQEAALAELAGEDFGRWFAKHYALAVKKEIAEDPVKLEATVASLAKALGKEKFAEIFDVTQRLQPTEEFTQERHEIEPDELEAFAAAGVKQIAALARG
jgi:hypothetical protein